MTCKPTNQEARLVVLWRVTSICNLSCHFCGYSKSLERPRLNVAERDVRNVVELLARYGEQSDRQVLITWLGGEPFLWPPLLRMSRICKTELGLETGVTTNAQPLFNKAVRQQAVDLFDEITISIDGIGSTHDELRDSPGLFERIKQIVPSIRDERPRTGKRPLIRVNTILMRRTVDLFEEFCLEIAGWGVDEITFNQLGGNDRPEFYPGNCLTPDQVERFAHRLPAIRDRLARFNVKIPGGSSYLKRILYTLEGSRIPVADCGPGEEFLFIDEYGTASPCSFTGNEYGVSIRDLSDVSAIAELPERFRKLRRERTAAACCDCPSTQVSGKYEDVAAC